MRDLEIFRGNYIAHRGYHNPSNPENTMGAFQLAIDNDFGIEMDIHLSKDKQVVVFHDDDLKRVTGVEGKIWDYDYDYLKTLKILDTDANMPLFSSFLELVQGQTFLVIELKTHKEDNNLLVDKAIEMLRKYKGKFVVQSFDPTIIARFKKYAPEMIRGQLVSSFKNEKLSWIKKFLLSHMITNCISKPDFINTDVHYYTNKMKRFKSNGGSVICYTIRNKQDQEYAKKYFDNIIFENFDPREE